MMVTSVWNPLGFQFLDGLPKGTHLIPSTTVLIFSQSFFRSACRLTGGDSLLMLATQDPTPSENADFCEENRLRLGVDPPYPPDLALYDFFLFGHIKHCLQGIAFPSREE
jgi:hypothetical protein